MVKVLFKDHAGREQSVEAATGVSVMQAAVSNGVVGIDADCGGSCSCATCHVHIDEAWAEKVGPADEAESGMLELEDEVSETSRLGCQVQLTPELDGLVVRVVGR